MAISVTQWRDDAQYFEFEGHRIAYFTIGRGAPLLMVHGFPTSSWDWTPIWDKIDGNKHHLIAADMLGFGLSDKPRDGYSLMKQADLQEAFLAHLGITKFSAVVHDYGVSVGQELLARQAEGSGAEGLDRMVFLNGGIFPSQHRPLTIQRLGVSPLGPLVSRFLTRERFARSLASTFGPHTKPTDAEIDAYWELICHNDGHRIMHRLLHYIADRRAHEERLVTTLRQARNRIGLINGASDPVSGEHAFNRWVEYLPEANAYLLPDIGHYPQVEAPDRTGQLILEWLG
ncbi:MAG: alpha/beta hydrolase [Pontixanthobacter sp.]